MNAGLIDRFGWFACAHILWSLTSFFLFLGECRETLPRAWGTTAFLMLGYLLWGWAIARLYRWPRPTARQSWVAVLLPAAIAWLWAGCTAVSLYSHNSEMAIVLGFPALFLASPSLLFVETCMAAAGAWTWGWLSVAIFFAGLLPPLLFFLGSLLAS